MGILKNFNTNYHKQHEQSERDLGQKKCLLFKEECYGIYGCIYAVNKKLGSGFLEAVYQEALEIELGRSNIPFVSHQELEILYDGVPLTKKYIADIICYNKIILEVKTVSKITDQHKAQLTNYLAATGYRLGLLVNFNSFPKAEIIRMAR